MTTLAILIAGLGLFQIVAVFVIISAIRLGKECDRLANELHAENRKDRP